MIHFELITLPLCSFVHMLFFYSNSARMIQLLHSVHILHLGAGDVLMCQGMHSDGIYLIKEGECDVVREIGMRKTKEGLVQPPTEYGHLKPLLINKLSVYDHFGDTCTYRHEQHYRHEQVSVIATTRVTLVWLPLVVLDELLPAAVTRFIKKVFQDRRIYRRARIKQLLEAFPPEANIYELPKSILKRSAIFKFITKPNKGSTAEQQAKQQREHMEDGNQEALDYASLVSSSFTAQSNVANGMKMIEHTKLDLKGTAPTKEHHAPLVQLCKQYQSLGCLDLYDSHNMVRRFII